VRAATLQASAPATPLPPAAPPGPLALATSPSSGGFNAYDNGVSYTCRVGTDGTRTCSGDNHFDLPSPPSGTFSAVSAGFLHTCGVKTDGTLACCGSRHHFGNLYGGSLVWLAANGAVASAVGRSSRR
jgi:hypothetical protein